MKNSLTIASIYVLIIFFSCKKWGDSTVEGNVFEDGSNAPVTNVEVFLLETNQRYSRTEAEGTRTDQNGHFKFIYHNKLMNRFTYSILVKSPDHFTKDILKPIENKNLKTDIFLSPLSFANFRIKNNLQNEVKVSVSVNDQFQNLIFYNGKSISPNSDSVYTELARINGFGKTPISVTFLGNTFRDTIICNKKNDTLTFLIEIN
jgi:hypothetical protein